MPQEIKNLTQGAATINFAGANMGYTEDAVVINKSSELLKYDKIQQKMGTHAIKQINYAITIKANLVENTLENIKALWGITSNVSQIEAYRQLDGSFDGNLKTGPLEILGTGPGDVDRTYYFYKMILTECGDLAIDGRAYAKISATWEAVWDSTQTNLFYIREDYVPTAA